MTGGSAVWKLVCYPDFKGFAHSAGTTVAHPIGGDHHIPRSQPDPNHSLVGIINRLNRFQGLCFANEETQLQGNDLIDFIF